MSSGNLLERTPLCANALVPAQDGTQIGSPEPRRGTAVPLRGSGRLAVLTNCGVWIPAFAGMTQAALPPKRNKESRVGP